METEVWRWQNDGNGTSAYKAAVTLTDGHLLVVGWESSDTGTDSDFLAIKIDPSDGSLIWRWKDGSSENESIDGAAAGANGSVILAGSTDGNWSGTAPSGKDYAGVKLDANGNEIWRLQGGSGIDDRFDGVAVGQDGYAVFGGRSSNNFYLMKVDDNGDTIWEWSGDSGEVDAGKTMAMPGDDDSVVLGGKTSGNWSGVSAGGVENAAVKVDSDGNEVWRWQGGSSAEHGICSMVATDDGSIIMSGDIIGSTVDDVGDGTPRELSDVVAIKLDTNGTELWKWQGGTVRGDGAFGSALAGDGSLILGGFTFGNWSAIPQGVVDVMVATLDASDGSLLSWRWQDGTTGSDYATSIVTGRTASEWVAIVGTTFGSFAGNNSEENMEGFVVMFTPGASTVGPSPSPTPSPFRTPTPMPALAPTPGVNPTSPMIHVPTPTPLPQAPSETLAPSSMNVSTPAPSTSPVYGPPSTLLTSPAPTMPSSSKASPGGSDSSSMMLVISVVVAVASGLALLALVFGWRRMPLRLRRQFSRSSAGDLVEGNGGAGSASASVRLKRGSANGGESGEDNSREFSKTQEGPNAILDNNDVLLQENGYSSTVSSHGALAVVMHQSRSAAMPADLPAYDNVMKPRTTPSGHGENLSAAPSQEAPATIVNQSRSVHEDDAPPGYEDAMQRDTSQSSSSSVCKLEDTGITTAKRNGATPESVPDHLGSETTRGTESFTGYAGAVLKLYASTSQGTATSSARHVSSKVESVDGGSAIVGFDATNESKSESSSASGIGVSQAILETARELAQASMIPALSEAMAMISVLVRLVSDNKQNDSGAGGKLRWCKTIVTLLGQAAYLLGEDQGLSDEVKSGLLEDVRESIDDLVQLIQTYKSKNKLVRVITSSLFKRRQEELEAAISKAVSHLQVGLQIHGDHKLNAVRQDVKDALLFQQQQQQAPQGSVPDDVEQSRAEWRRQRRQRQLEQLEIPEEQLTLTDELLGKGGFGSVYIADYNGRNAAAKILATDHDLAGSEHSASGHGLSRRDSSTRSLGLQNDQRRAFLRELDAMRRLRSPYTVNVYGAVTSRRDRLILVMELMSGGDLRKFLKGASGPIEEERARRIVGEVCAGMAFLHDKQTIHGDLKSANVLFDGYDRAKICDFGTSRWAEHGGSTDLATYTSGVNKSTPMSLPWTAPEVLNSGERSFKSDVYSFGMITWEVLTRKIPWANESEVLQIYQRVVFKEERPDIPDEAPSDLVEIVRSCWMAEPSRRPSFQWLLGNMKSNGWMKV